jgi:hypothetical protein
MHEGKPHLHCRCAEKLGTKFLLVCCLKVVPVCSEELRWDILAVDLRDVQNVLRG